MAELTRDALIALAKDCGADDAGVVSLDRPELDGDRPHILSAFPRAKTLLSLVVRMNVENVRTPWRSIANKEFHTSIDHTDHVAAALVRRLGDMGIGAINPSAGFPMEMGQFPDGRIWVVSHKLAAVAAGLGQMGIHRNLIHPVFGNFVLLGTVILDAEIAEQSQQIDYNPCFECKLCVAACPVGAIKSDGAFDFSACYTHNYREFMGGFTEWTERIAESASAKELRGKVSDSEQASMWQSLGFGPNYKAAYCMAVCPAGESLIDRYQLDKKQYLKDVVDPLRDKIEPVYVVPGSDAEAHLAKRFPHKQRRPVGSGLRPRTVPGFLRGLRLVFQRDQAKGLDCIYHFTFTGTERGEATITIRDSKLIVEQGHHGKPQLRVRVDSRAWFAFIYKERGLLSMLASGRLRLRGNPRYLVAFGKCFPT